ncbi:MAG: RpoL/Rpb11 RNA polymerase subunit family protein [Candidatus Thorarchaeota archaeon]
MAKKKAVKAEETAENDLDEIDEELLDDEEIENIYPKLKEKEQVKPTPPSDDEYVEELEEEFEEEEEARFPSYKYLDVGIMKGIGENDYEVTIEGQSHGFCNILVKHLLEVEGVNMAAYKVNNVELPKIFIRLENSKTYKIKDILNKGIESLREEVLEVQKKFKKFL